MNTQKCVSVERRSSPEKMDNDIRQESSPKNSSGSEGDNLLFYESFYDNQTKDKSCFKNILTNLSENLQQVRNQNNYHFNFPRLQSKPTKSELWKDEKQNTSSNGDLMGDSQIIPLRTRSQGNREATDTNRSVVIDGSNEISRQRKQTPVLPQILPAKTVGVDFEPPKKQQQPFAIKRSGIPKEEAKSEKSYVQKKVDMNQQLVEIMKKMQGDPSPGHSTFKVPVLEAYKNYAFHPSPTPRVLAVSNMEHQRHYSPEISAKWSQRKRFEPDESPETKTKVRLTEEELKRLWGKYSTSNQESGQNENYGSRNALLVSSIIKMPSMLGAKKHHPSFDFRLKNLSINTHGAGPMKSEEIVENIHAVLRAGRMREASRRFRAESNDYLESKNNRNNNSMVAAPRTRQLESAKSNQSMIDDLIPITKHPPIIHPKRSSNDFPHSAKRTSSFKYQSEENSKKREPRYGGSFSGNYEHKNL